MRCTINTSCISLVVVALSAALCRGQHSKTGGEGIDPATVAAYEKLGAVYGRFGSDLRFDEGREGAEKGLPVFQIRVIPKGKLPEVDSVSSGHYRGGQFVP